MNRSCSWDSSVLGSAAMVIGVPPVLTGGRGRYTVGAAMKLATADFSWPLLPHDRVLQLIRLLDIGAVDLGLFAGRSHVTPEMVRADVPMWGGILRERLERAGLELADLFVQAATTFEPLALNNPDPAARDETRALFADMLELARR